MKRSPLLSPEAWEALLEGIPIERRIPLMSDRDNIPETTTDDKAASALHRELLEHLHVLCGLMDKATKRGLRISFSLGTDPTGRAFVQSAEIARVLVK